MSSPIRDPSLAVLSFRENKRERGGREGERGERERGVRERVHIKPEAVINPNSLSASHTLSQSPPDL